MKVLKVASVLALSLFLGACSSSSTLNSTSMKGDYYTKTFSHTEFTANNRNTTKKPLSSDHALMVSLLNRPMPEDQRMMLAFAKQQESYLPDSTIVGIQIRGNKADDKVQQQNISIYADIIAQDNNAVAISAMPK